MGSRQMAHSSTSSSSLALPALFPVRALGFTELLDVEVEALTLAATFFFALTLEKTVALAAFLSEKALGSPGLFAEEDEAVGLAASP